MRKGLKLTRVGKIVYSIIAIAAFAAIALVVMLFVAHSGLYPGGPDSYYHIYRGELVYNSIAGGNWYPLYDPSWYNGVEIMRYGAPLCPYFYALCMAIAQPFILSSFGGYLIFTWMIFFLGAIVWYIIGMKKNRPFLGTALAILWFFMPNNLYTLFGEGNLSRSLCMVILPIFIFSIYQYMNTRKVRHLSACTISYMLIVLCDFDYGLLLALALLIYMGIYVWSTSRFLDAFRVIFSSALGFLITGLWTIPRLFGGAVSVVETDSTKGIYQNLFISINPIYRVNTDVFSYYFGLAALILALFGALLSYKVSRSGFWLGLVILALTTEMLHSLINLIPGGSNVWMLRLISIALCFILMSYMEWRTLKKPLIIFMTILLVADTIPSLYYVYGDRNGFQPEESISQFADKTLLDKAKSITKQRLCVLDEGGLESIGAYVPVVGKRGVKTTSGSGWESAEINRNIVNLNKGVNGQAYTYTFDRAMELGNDTVLFCLFGDNEVNSSEIDVCAQRAGYKLIDSEGRYRLYSLAKTHPDTWGVVTEYKAISIGNGANIIARQFPYFKEGGSAVLDDYTFDDLKDYELIYLTTFEFRNRSYAEDLVLKLSEAGVKIVISADGVPDDRSANARVFLGVVCNPISFSQGFPLLKTIEGDLDTDLFPADSREWKTYFCDGLDEVWGKVNDDNYDIPFLGTVKNDNIIFVGLNLTFYYGVTRDRGVEKLLSKIMSLSTTTLPQREIVPLEVQYEADRITISSENDNVNTTLAYHNFFSSDIELENDNHLLYVSKGVTEIALGYPYFVEGLLCTILSIIVAVINYSLIYIRNKPKRAEAAAVVSYTGLGTEMEEEEGVLSAEEFEEVRDRYNRIGFEYMDVDTDDDYDFDYDIEYETNYDVESKTSDMDYSE